MTREEIISNLLYMKHSVKEDTVEDITINEAINALEQQPCEVEATKLQQAYNKGFEDCRQAVIDMTGLSEWFDSSDSYNEFVIALSGLPSVTPQHCTDAISRQAVLDLPRIKIHNQWGNVIKESVDVEGVRQLPPVTPAEKQEPYKDWYDVPSDEMTLEQAQQAVKDLRKKLAEYLEQQPCEDAISRQAMHIELEKWITYGEYKYTNATKYLYDRIDRLPPVTPAEKVGKWIMHIDDLFPAESTMECNKCHEHQPITIDDNYCPNCGAKMEVKE